MLNKIDTKDYLKNNPVNPDTGLTDIEVQSRIDSENVNFISSDSKSTKEIILNNAVTPFNILCTSMVALVLITGSLRNSLFFGIVIMNTFIGIYQEIKAKKTLEKLSILKHGKVFILRNKNEIETDRSEIVLDDILVLKKGTQVPVDCILVSDDVIEVDESMLTGESNSILKKYASIIYSGSIILQGQSKGQAFHVGKNTYISQLSAEAKTFKQKKSKLQIEINQIIKIVTFLLVPVGLLLFISQLLFVKGLDWREALLGSVTGIIGMVPEGLVLLTTVALVVGVINLAKMRILTQELSAIETLARVDTLCLDKTGTLTEGKLIFKDLIPYSANIDFIGQALSALVFNDKEQNASSKALKESFSLNTDWKVKNVIPFSSEAKWQAIEFEKYGTFVLGAPDIIIPTSDEKTLAEFNNFTESGYRVIALTKSSNSLEKHLPVDLEIMALILLEDKVRDDAKDILKYFKAQNVNIKVISGDNVRTLAHVCKEVGLSGKSIDAKYLPENMQELRHLVKETTIFGRVKPEQKKDIIKALKDNGHVVAMTGDGVNDILALKQSDCGIAMASGSEATQSVAQFVLLDSKFSSLPEVVNQGRRVINNINRVASIFLVKTTYSFLLSLIFAIEMFQYPFKPIQLSLINFFAIALPAFLLALEPNHEIVKGNFFKKTLTNVLPGGIVIACAIYYMVDSANDQLEHLLNLSNAEISTMAILVAICIHFWTLFLICQPMTKWRITVLTAVIFSFASVFLIRPVISFYGFVYLRKDLLIFMLILCAISMAVTYLLRILCIKYIDKVYSYIRKKFLFLYRKKRSIR